MTKNSQNIDNFFKGALDSYREEQPSKAVWKGISGKLFWHDLVHLNWLNIPYFVPAIITLVAVGVAVALLTISHGENKNPIIDEKPESTNLTIKTENAPLTANDQEIKTNTNIEQETLIDLSSDENSENIKSDNVIQKPSGEKETIQNDPIKTNIVKSTGVKTKSASPDGISLNEKITDEISRDIKVDVSEVKAEEYSNKEKKFQTISAETTSKAYDPVILSEKTNLNEKTEYLLKRINYLKLFEIDQNPIYNDLNLIPYSEVTGAGRSNNAFDYYTRKQYSIGLHFTPEKMYNSPDDHADKNIFSIDLSLIYQVNKYILQTGLGYTYFENDHNYRVNYQEFLGTYNDLDSIAFTYDPGSNSVIPNYFWTETTVYDTVNQALESGITNHYSTLQIPLLIGYKIFEKKRFSMFVKGGPLISILISKNEPGATYYSPDKRVTSIDYATPSRTNFNWQFQGSIGLGYQINQRFGLAVEPTIKYYFNNIYGRNKNADIKPYLFGVRAGLIYTIK